jgi:putative SOS response-associated peptidase YedK
MCLLYRLDSQAQAIADAFDADPGADPWSGDYVAPGKFAPIIVRGREGRRLVPRVWGVPPPPRVDRPVCNVRNLDSPFWIGTLRHIEYRCIVPVTSFMEWGGVKGARVQHWFTVPSEPVFGFAGIWRDSEVASFAFLTTDPNSLVERVHDKSMPLILAPEDYERWLTADWPNAAQLVSPFPSQLMLMESRGPA